MVIGIVETHGRVETAEKSRRPRGHSTPHLQYRGINLTEMDLDAIIARKPEVAIVDELAHTNAPGSRHDKRYQDIEELIANGISVITAINIQQSRASIR